MNREDINLVHLLIKSDLSIRHNNPYDNNVISDVMILKDFNLPVVKNSEIFNKSMAHRLLEDRNSRPSMKVWRILRKMAKESDLNIENVAELYFHLLDNPVESARKYPMRDDTIPAEDAMPNIVGHAMEGLGLMADDKKEDCT